MLFRLYSFRTGSNCFGKGRRENFRKAVLKNERYIIHLYSSYEELTPEILRSFIDKVIIHEKPKVDGHYRQTVEIVYNFVGAIDRPIWGDELDENN